MFDKFSKKSKNDKLIMVREKMRNTLNNRAYRESMSIFPDWPNILEKALNIKFDEIFQKFQSAGLNFKNWEEWLAPNWGANYGISFETHYEPKSGLKISTNTIFNHGSHQHFSGRMYGFIFSEKILELARTTDNKSLQKLTEAGIDRKNLETIIVFENDGSISLVEPNPVDFTNYVLDITETLIQLPIDKLRTLGLIGGGSPFSNADLSYYFDVLNNYQKKDIRDFGPHYPVRPLDLMKKELNDLGFEYELLEDNHGERQKDSFRSKFGTIHYEVDGFEPYMENDELLRQILISIVDYNNKNFKK